MNYHMWASLVLGVSTNIDNFGVGTAYGIKRVRIGHTANVLIATFNALATMLSMTAGAAVGKLLPESTSNAVGATIIILAGVYGLYDTYFASRSEGTTESLGSTLSVSDFVEHPEASNKNRSGTLNINEALPLAIALSISNLGTGVGAGLAGFNMWFLIGVMFVFSWLMIILGGIFGKITSMVLPDRWPSTVSGLLLIGVGVRDLLF